MTPVSPLIVAASRITSEACRAAGCNPRLAPDHPFTRRLLECWLDGRITRAVFIAEVRWFIEHDLDGEALRLTQ